MIRRQRQMFRRNPSGWGGRRMLLRVISFLLLFIIYCQIASGAIAINEKWIGSGYLWTSTNAFAYGDMMSGTGNWSYTRMLDEDAFGSYAEFNGTSGAYRIAYSWTDFACLYTMQGLTDLLAANSAASGVVDLSLSGTGSVRSFVITPTSDGRHWDDLARSYSKGTFNLRSVISSEEDGNGSSENT